MTITIDRPAGTEENDEGGFRGMNDPGNHSDLALPTPAVLAPTPDVAAVPEKGLWHYIGLSLSAALLIIVVALAVITLVIPKVAGATPLTVLTSSMEPSLPPGTLIVVRPVAVEDLRIGDVVTYQMRSGEPEVITHRIIGISSTSAGDLNFTLKGDNNSDPDTEPVIEAQVQGKLWYSIPYIGFANNAVNGESRAWIVPIAAGLLLAYAGYMIASGLRAAAQERREKRAADSAIRPTY